MRVFYKNFSFFASLLLHVTVILFCSLNLSLPNLSRFESLHSDQLIIIDTVSMGEFNNIKLFSQASSNKKDSAYNEKYDRQSAKNIEKTTIVKSEKTIDKKSKIMPDKKSDQQIKKKDTITSTDPAVKKQKKDLNKSTTNTTTAKQSSPKSEIASILNSIEQSKGKGNISNTKTNQDGLVGAGVVEQYDLNQQMTIKTTDLIRSKFIKCWTVPVGAKDVENLRVNIQIALTPEGQVVSAIISNNFEYNHNSFFRAMADSALRAVYRCSPITDLPADQYQIWKEIELYFDPKDMF